MIDELRPAWHQSQMALLMVYPVRHFGHFYIYNCFLPVQVRLLKILYISYHLHQFITRYRL
jgi:hypothetical protein